MNLSEKEHSNKAKSKKQKQFFNMVKAVQKGALPANKVNANVRDAAKDASPKDVNSFVNTPDNNLPVKVKRTKKDEAFAPTPQQNAGVPNFFDVVGQYNKLGEFFDKKHSFTELAQHLGDIAEYAEQTLTNETADDWFDAHTIKRNVSEMRKYSNDFRKIATEADQFTQRMHAYYEDMGNVLERYFDIMDEPGTDKLSHIDDANPDADPQVQSSVQDESKFSTLSNKLSHEKGVTNPDALAATIGREKYGKKSFQHKAEDGKNESAFHEKYAPQIHEKVVGHLRSKLSELQLERFNQLRPETQLEMAWKLVR